MSVPTNEIIYEKDFWKDVRDLPKKVQNKLGELIDILREDPFDPRLHTKRLGPPIHDAFSFRVTRDYRVGFEFTASRTIKLLIADTRGNTYKRLLRKR